MTHANATTIRVPWLRHSLRRPRAAQVAQARSHMPLLPARQRRALGIAMTAAGGGTIVMSAAELAAQSTPASAAQLLLATAATVTVAHCTAAGGEDGDI